MTTFTDDFNRADSTNLGAGWVEVTGDWSIVSNQLSSGSAGGTIILRASTSMATSDNSAQVTIAATAAVSHGVWCRGSTSLSSGYLWRNDGTSWNLFSVVGGSFTNIGSYTAAAVAGDVAKIQAVGSTIKGFVNGVQRVSVTDTNVATGTSVGIRAESTNALRFDDFTGADVTTGVSGDAALSNTATLSATGLRATASATGLTATASLAAGGIRATSADAALTATVTLAASGTTATAGDAALVASAALTTSGKRTTAGDATLAAAATLAAGGQRDTIADTGLAATAALAADGVRTTQADTGLTAITNLVAQGQVAHNAAAAVTGTVTLTADGSTSAAPVLADAALNATGTLTATGARAAAADIGLHTAAAFTAAGTTALAGNAAIAVTATLTASGTTRSTHDDVNITIGAPCSPWKTAAPQRTGWEVDAPW